MREREREKGEGGMEGEGEGDGQRQRRGGVCAVSVEDKAQVFYYCVWVQFFFSVCLGQI